VHAIAGLESGAHTGTACADDDDVELMELNHD
jgi:hypothetical protein